MNDLQNKEIDDALIIIERLFPLIDEAEIQFRKSRFWGAIDLFGGGFLVNLIKHAKLNNAASIMNQINLNLQQLQCELKDIDFGNYSMNTFSFATLADFMWDGILADAYMQAKIIKSMNAISNLREQLFILKNNLLNIKKSR